MILISLLYKTWLTKAIQFRMFNVSRQRPMKSLSSVCPSVRPSLSFLKIESLVHHYNWPWYLVSDEARLKKNGSPNLGQTHCCHCVPDSGHIPRMILALPWSQIDNNNNNNNNNNNSATFVRLLNTNPKSPRWNITDGSIWFCHCNCMIWNR